MGKPNNTVTIQGRLAYKPELETASSGAQYTKLLVIIDDSYKARSSGEIVDTSQVIPATVFGDHAAKVCQKAEGTWRSRWWVI